MSRKKVSEQHNPSLERSVRLDNVSFKYGKHWVLHEASLEVPAGFFTSITGIIRNRKNHGGGSSDWAAQASERADMD